MAFEGIDGAGKSSLLIQVAQSLRYLGYASIHLSEPSYGPIGRQIRNRLQSGTLVSVEEQFELFTADRREHVANKIEPLLELSRSDVVKGGVFLLQDRSYYSSPAYQARSPREMAMRIESQEAFAPQPDLVFLLDIPVETALKRIEERQLSVDLLEKKEILERVRSNYLSVARANANFIILNANQPKEAVLQLVMRHLNIGPFTPN